MKIGLVITTFNRPVELAQCLQSLQQCDLPEDLHIILMDDASTDTETKMLFGNFQIEGAVITKATSMHNRGIREQLKHGIDLLFRIGCDIVINLDSDAIVKPDFFTKLIDLKTRFPYHIITGFNSINKNKNGSERHPVINKFAGYWLKSSVGGINMVFAKEQYEKYIRPALETVGNWDANTCIASMKDQLAIICCVPSVVQHLATKSSMGHAEEPDVACDFKLLSLPNVTLIGIDCSETYTTLLDAARICETHIDFAETKMLTSIHKTSFVDRVIPDIKTKEEYSKFVITQLHNYFSTSHCLLIQYDGYVVNVNAWSDEFLQYDYIGATWWFKDRMNVGNGGFSLRSKRLMEIVATDPNIKRYHPEDNIICRDFRPYLEKTHGIKFAPEDLANLFSIEAYNSPDKIYSGQFGFHGFNIDFSKSNIKINARKPARWR